MKHLVIFLAAILIACLALADAVWPKQPELLIDPPVDAGPGVFPAATNEVRMPETMLCVPLTFGDPLNKPIVRT